MHMKKRKKKLLFLLIVVLFFVGAVFGAVNYAKYRETKELENYIKAGEKATEDFSGAKNREEKLRVLKDFKADYAAYKKAEEPLPEVLEDYEERIGEMEENLTQFYAETIMSATYETVGRKKTEEELRNRIDNLEKLLEQVESEKEVVSDGENQYSNRLKKLIKTYADSLEDKQEEEAQIKERGEAVLAALEEYRQTNHDIGDEGAFYEKYIRYIKIGMENGFEAVWPSDFDLPSVFHEQTGTYGATFGYAVMDLDADGVKELLLGDNNNEDGHHTLYGIYAICDGKMVLLAEGWERNRYYLCTNGAIANESSSGASGGSEEFYSYKNGSLELIEAVYIDIHNKHVDGNSYIHTTSKEWADHAGYISREKRDEICSRYIRADLKLTPFF